MLRQPWVAPDLIKPPKAQRLPDILTVAEARRLFQATEVVSYRVFLFTLYSLGLRLGEGLRRPVPDPSRPPPSLSPCPLLLAGLADHKLPKAIFIVQVHPRTGTGLVHQTVQLVARFARTI